MVQIEQTRSPQGVRSTVAPIDWIKHQAARRVKREEPKEEKPPPRKSWLSKILG